MKYITCWLLAAVAILFSCSTDINLVKYGHLGNVVFLTEESLPPLQKLNLEKIELPESCMASQYLVYHDSVLIALHVKAPDPYYVTFMKMGTWEVLGEYCKRGQGPGELIGAGSFSLNSNMLKVVDYPGRTTVVFDVDSLLKDPIGYTPKYLKDKKVSIVGCLSDSLFVTFNRYFFNDDVRYASSPEAKELFLFNDACELRSETSFENDFFTTNVIGGIFAVNRTRRRIIYYRWDIPVYTVYDFDLNPVRWVVGPEQSDQQYMVSEDESSNMVYMGDIRNRFAIGSTADGGTAFYGNARAFHHVANRELMSKNTAEIFRMDFDGNITARYHCKGNPILTMSFCEASNTLYITGQDEVEENTLYRARL